MAVSQARGPKSVLITAKYRYINPNYVRIKQAFLDYSIDRPPDSPMTLFSLFRLKLIRNL
jgi:hypothetical protein